VQCHFSSEHGKTPSLGRVRGLTACLAETVKHGACTLPIGNVAALTGVSETTVRKAVREARQLGLLHVEERRVSAFHNLPNKLTITSREWLLWLRMHRRGWGSIRNRHAYQRINKARRRG
jgi:hypothetical protein